MSKTCSKCHIEEPLSDYYIAAKATGQYRTECKSCWTAYSNERRLKREYNLSKDQYNQMFIDHNFTCSICEIHQSEVRRLVVDHDHKTGALRGLLCDECNTGLGKFKDQPILLEKAITYLSRPKLKLVSGETK